MGIDLNKFFSFLNTGVKEEELDENLETFKKTPYFKIGMFKKLIKNGLIFKHKVLIFFKSSDETIDVRDIDLAGDYMLYERAWFWISQMDWEDEFWINDLKSLSDHDMVDYLGLCIFHYEKMEEFEKCASLKKILDFVKENLED
jgi:hypothetical protein